MPGVDKTLVDDPDYVPPKYKTVIYLYRDKETQLFKLRTYYFRKAKLSVNYSEYTDSEKGREEEVVNLKNDFVVNRILKRSEFLCSGNRKTQGQQNPDPTNKFPGGIAKRRKSIFITRSRIFDSLMNNAMAEKLILTIKKIQGNEYVVERHLSNIDDNNNSLQTEALNCELQKILKVEVNRDEVGKRNATLQRRHSVPATESPNDLLAKRLLTEFRQKDTDEIVIICDKFENPDDDDDYFTEVAGKNSTTGNEKCKEHVEECIAEGDENRLEICENQPEECPKEVENGVICNEQVEECPETTEENLLQICEDQVEQYPGLMGGNFCDDPGDQCPEAIEEIELETSEDPELESTEVLGEKEGKDKELDDCFLELSDAASVQLNLKVSIPFEKIEDQLLAKVKELGKSGEQIGDNLNDSEGTTKVNSKEETVKVVDGWYFEPPDMWNPFRVPNIEELYKNVNDMEHYKKRLIQQHEQPTPSEPPSNQSDVASEEGVQQNNVKTSTDAKTEGKKEVVSKVARKRAVCRGQFRHKDLPLFKLGTGVTRSLCKTKESYNISTEKPTQQPQPTSVITERQQKEMSTTETTEFIINAMHNGSKKSQADKSPNAVDINKNVVTGRHILPAVVPEVPQRRRGRMASKNSEKRVNYCFDQKDGTNTETKDASDASSMSEESQSSSSNYEPSTDGASNGPINLSLKGEGTSNSSRRNSVHFLNSTHLQTFTNAPKQMVPNKVNVQNVVQQKEVRFQSSLPNNGKETKQPNERLINLQQTINYPKPKDILQQHILNKEQKEIMRTKLKGDNRQLQRPIDQQKEMIPQPQNNNPKQVETIVRQPPQEISNSSSKLTPSTLPSNSGKESKPATFQEAFSKSATIKQTAREAPAKSANRIKISVSYPVGNSGMPQQNPSTKRQVIASGTANSTPFPEIENQLSRISGSYHIEIGEPSNVKQVETPVECDEAIYITSIITMCKSTMETECSVPILLALSRWYSQLQEFSTQPLLRKLKAQIVGCMQDIIFYAASKIFGSKYNLRLKKYIEKFIMLPLCLHRDFLTQNISLIEEYCQDDIWLENLMRKLSQTTPLTDPNILRDLSMHRTTQKQIPSRNSSPVPPEVTISKQNDVVEPNAVHKNILSQLLASKEPPDPIITQSQIQVITETRVFQTHPVHITKETHIQNNVPRESHIVYNKVVDQATAPKEVPPVVETNKTNKTGHVHIVQNNAENQISQSKETTSVLDQLLRNKEENIAQNTTPTKTPSPREVHRAQNNVSKRVPVTNEQPHRHHNATITSPPTGQNKFSDQRPKQPHVVQNNVPKQIHIPKDTVISSNKPPSRMPGPAEAYIVQHSDPKTINVIENNQAHRMSVPKETRVVQNDIPNQSPRPREIHIPDPHMTQYNMQNHHHGHRKPHTKIPNQLHRPNEAHTIQNNIHISIPKEAHIQYNIPNHIPEPNRSHRGENRAMHVPRETHMVPNNITMQMGPPPETYIHQNHPNRIHRPNETTVSTRMHPPKEPFYGPNRVETQVQNNLPNEMWIAREPNVPHKRTPKRPSIPNEPNMFDNRQVMPGSKEQQVNYPLPIQPDAETMRLIYNSILRTPGPNVMINGKSFPKELVFPMYNLGLEMDYRFAHGRINDYNQSLQMGPVNLDPRLNFPYQNGNHQNISMQMMPADKTETSPNRQLMSQTVPTSNNINGFVYPAVHPEANVNNPFVVPQGNPSRSISKNTDARSNGHGTKHKLPPNYNYGALPPNHNFGAHPQNLMPNDPYYRHHVNGMHSHPETQVHKPDFRPNAPLNQHPQQPNDSGRRRNHKQTKPRKIAVTSTNNYSNPLPLGGFHIPPSTEITAVSKEYHQQNSHLGVTANENRDVTVPNQHQQVSTNAVHIPEETQSSIESLSSCESDTRFRSANKIQQKDTATVAAAAAASSNSSSISNSISKVINDKPVIPAEKVLDPIPVVEKPVNNTEIEDMEDLLQTNIIVNKNKLAAMPSTIDTSNAIAETKVTEPNPNNSVGSPISSSSSETADSIIINDASMKITKKSRSKTPPNANEAKKETESTKEPEVDLIVQKIESPTDLEIKREQGEVNYDLFGCRNESHYQRELREVKRHLRETNLDLYNKIVGTLEAKYRGTGEVILIEDDDDDQDVIMVPTNHQKDLVVPIDQKKDIVILRDQKIDIVVPTNQKKDEEVPTNPKKDIGVLTNQKKEQELVVKANEKTVITSLKRPSSQPETSIIEPPEKKQKISNFIKPTDSPASTSRQAQTARPGIEDISDEDASSLREETLPPLQSITSKLGMQNNLIMRSQSLDDSFNKTNNMIKMTYNNSRSNLSTSPLRNLLVRDNNVYNNSSIQISPVSTPINNSEVNWSSWMSVEGRQRFFNISPVVRRQSVETALADELIEVKLDNNKYLIRKKFFEKIPQGKLFFIPEINMLIRYADDNEIKGILDHLHTKGTVALSEKLKASNHVYTVPKSIRFSPDDYLSDPAYYVEEISNVERHIPKDFYQFYKFVTGYQIVNNNPPVSFQTFLMMNNTERLRGLFKKFLLSLEEDTKKRS